MKTPQTCFNRKIPLSGDFYFVKIFQNFASKKSQKSQKIISKKTRIFHFLEKSQNNPNEAKKLFISKLPELLKKQKSKYAVAFGDTILVGEKQEDLFKEIVKKYGNVTMYIGKIVDENDKSELELVPKFVV